MITTAAAAPDADRDHHRSGERRGTPANRKIPRWARVLGWILAGILT